MKLRGGRWNHLCMDSAEAEQTFTIGGDLTVNRLGFGAMRLTGDGIWGEPQDIDEARKVPRRAYE
ncbi:MAG: hypothetical protein ACRD3Y_05940, partial [Bryobacteraceae bacterium]